ncbi:MAG: hypothetical protein KatS3mg003_1714 [Candidatus Nitrosocaldaceae archaeon]|nr:MAG: hypothetical protein KatS3mg003_1714 [Candidatus Nitrosocaldaceae archaeon]
MKCVICNVRFDFEKGRGVNYRNKPICDECLLNLMFVCVDKHKDGLKRYLRQEIRLEYFS